MVLESTIICVDNSEFMRNGDYIPTRLEAQRDAVNLICHAKAKLNPENNFGLLTLSEHNVLVTLTTDVGKILSAAQMVRPTGKINFITGIRVAQLALKHRQTKTHKVRLVIFVGSPIGNSDKELITVAKKLKKENVAVDIISFGEDSANAEMLSAFISTVNGKGGSNSHLVTVSSGPVLSDALLSSPLMASEDGSSPAALGGGFGVGAMGGLEFGIDPNEDPELALALRVSLEEQRVRQEQQSKEIVTESNEGASQAATEGQVAMETSGEPGDNLEQALATAVTDDSVISHEPMISESGLSQLVLDPVAVADCADPNDEYELGEDDQLAAAIELSMQALVNADTERSEHEAMELSTEELVDQGVGSSSQKAGGELGGQLGTRKPQAKGKKADDESEDLTELMDDPDFLHSVLSGLPGVDPSSEAVQSVIQTTRQQKEEKERKKNDQ
ncbi:26S proteasome non-ATPase regulatory subunit 4-like isoform X2 [Corticium candelabrum]|uniref:26S proteasome non-ATPase regulatory subunit 4-like isoform X2 n=1 Tax=Corticium candelabrum TaxID=121492 RepID=UPI002E26FDDD|nr:26S proteasome non-ATPase regulatory subunit 4-like isoform X2 [Corticium candelabrum]